jgi:hypothetical protein
VGEDAGWEVGWEVGEDVGEDVGARHTILVESSVGYSIHGY